MSYTNPSIYHWFPLTVVNAGASKNLPIVNR